MKKSINVLYPDIYYEFWVDIMRKAYEMHNWEPVYVVSDPRYENSIRENIPGIIFHNRDKAIVGMPSEDCINDMELPAIDQEFLKQQSYDQSLFLHMLDRFDPGNNFTYRERVYYYHKMLRYWLGVINRYKPDLVVFPSVPHMGYDYIIYTLCKGQNIRMGMFLELPFGRFVIVENYSDHFPVWEKYEHCVKRKDSFILSEEIEAYLSNITDTYEKAVPYFMKKHIGNSLHNKYKNIAKRQKNKWLPVLQDIINFNYILHTEPRKTDSKEKNKKWTYLTSRRNHRNYKRDAEKNREKVKAYYKEHIVAYDKNVNYIYIPLHYQPEESSCPLGEVYAHQYLFIEIVSKSVPPDWKLYVKEHALQFSGSLTGARSRNKRDYDQILEIPNVSFLDSSVSTFELIDNARAVATITGTAGWEAVNRGVPVVLFGHPWYKGCEGVFYTPTISQCTEVMNKIKNGYKPDRNKVKVFAYAADTVSTRGALHPAAAKEFNIGYEENVENITNELINYFDQKQRYAYTIMRI